MARPRLSEEGAVQRLNLMITDEENRAIEAWRSLRSSCRSRDPSMTNTPTQGEKR